MLIVAKRPLVLPGEPAAGPAQHTLLWTEHAADIVMEPAKTLRDVSAVGADLASAKT